MQLKGENGMFLTEGLFYETSPNKKYAMYSLKEQSHDEENYPSAYKIYMESTDEYEAAMKLVGSMQHWRKLCGLKWFLEGRVEAGHTGLNKWREDMRMRDENIAKKVLLEKAKEGDIQAAKKLFDEAKRGAKGVAGQKRTPKKQQKDSLEASIIKEFRKGK